MRRHFYPTVICLALLAGCDDVPDLSLPNEPPQANDDTVALLQDQTTDINIGSNDRDVDGNLVSIEILEEPQNGTITETVVNAVRYVPDRLFVGEDTFVYQITDEAGESDTATVNITVKARQTRALFTTTAEDGMRRLYLLDSRPPDTGTDNAVLTELSAMIDGESVRNWVYNSVEQTALMLTSGDRVVAVPLADPANPDAIESIEIPLTNAETIDDGMAFAANSGVVAFSVNNRFVRSLSLIENEFESFDTGWTTGTMTVSDFSTTGTSTIMSGTLGDPAVASLYLANLLTDGNTLALQQATETGKTFFSRVLAATNHLVWMLGDDAAATITPPFDCAQPSSEALSDLYAVPVLAVQTANIVNLNETSNLLGTGSKLFGYFIAPIGAKVIVAACPAGSDVVQLIEIPYAAANTATAIASLDSPTTVLHDVDVILAGTDLIYVAGDGSNAAPVYLDLSDSSAPVATTLADHVPQFQLYDDNGAMRAPPSNLAGDNRRWVFIAPDGGLPSEVVWLELDGLRSDPIDLDALTTSSSPLSFSTDDEPLSDGYSAFISTTDLDQPQAQTHVSLAQPGTAPTAFTVPGIIDRGGDPLGDDAILLLPVPLDESP
ncbi:MAG: cadherin-like domain-containing protein [Gammaproteobacteria bacterium]|nr:cadherin-like domain-containing protein [Gammaproteobacteria bacterium]